MIEQEIAAANDRMAGTDLVVSTGLSDN